VTVHIIATGGTISSHFDGHEWTNLDGAALVAELGDDIVRGVSVRDVATGPSSNLTADDMVGVARKVGEALAAGASGVVVVHGTDTMELTAFVCQLMLGTDRARRPVVFTGSMRVHSHAAPDGPANLRDAIAVAGSDAAIGREVMVCLEGILHAADRVSKCHAASVDAFHSAPFRPIGRLCDGVPVFDAFADERPAANGFVSDVPLVSCYPGIATVEVAAALDGRPGAVIEVFGDLNVPQQLWGPIHRAWNDGALVVLASRPFTPTTTNDGLAMLGAVGAGGLTAQKARLATMAALGSSPDRDTAIAFLHAYSLAFDARDRSTTS
jgi:L-asparaginase